MPQFETLTKVWKNPAVYGPIFKSFMDFRPDTELVEIPPIPGHIPSESQIFMTSEEDLGWIPWVRLDKKGNVYKVYLVGTKSFKQFVISRNQKEGWKGIKKSMLLLASGSDCASINAKGLIPTAKIFSAMPEYLQKMMNYSLLLRARNAKVQDNKDILFVRDGNVENLTWYYSGDGICTLFRSFFRIVEVPSNIKVQVMDDERDGKTIASAMKLLLPEESQT